MDFRSMSSPFPPPPAVTAPPRLWQQIDATVAVLRGGCVTLIYSLPSWDEAATEDEEERWLDAARALVLDAIGGGLCAAYGNFIEMGVSSDAGPRILRLLYQPHIDQATRQ